MGSFAAIRLAAAAAVVLGHSFVLTGAEPPTLLGAPIHVLAVRVFFVVSGYLVCDSWLRDPAPGRYLARRALRILPGLAAVVLLTAGILGPAATTLPLRDYARHPQTAEYLWNLLGAPRFALPGVFTDGRPFTAVNGSLWSLPVEAAMYLLLPLYAGRRRALALAPAAVAAALAFTVLWPAQVQPVVWDTSIPFGLRFAADFVLAAAIRLWRWERLLSLPAAIPALLLVQALTHPTIAHPLAAGLLSAVALPYAVLALALRRTPGWLEPRADLSYGIYLWAGPLQQLLLPLAAPGGWAALTALATPPILLAAALSWTVIERPALRWKPAARRTPAPPPGHPRLQPTP